MSLADGDGRGVHVVIPVVGDGSLGRPVARESLIQPGLGPWFCEMSLSRERAGDLVVCLLAARKAS